MFAPGMGHGDTLTGGEVFAALRLVGHAKSGRGVERGLAFVQGEYPHILQRVRLN